MSLEEITLALFAACNSIRVVAYVPQIFKMANDKNGASSISCIDMVPVPARAPLHRRLRTHQPLRLGVGRLLFNQRSVLRCHPCNGLLENGGATRSGCIARIGQPLVWRLEEGGHARETMPASGTNSPYAIAVQNVRS
jgi:hypothetical protein